MIVVSDSTTLIVLSDQNRLCYLQNLFTTVLISKTVFEEISYRGKVVLPEFIKIVEVIENEELDMLKLLLDDAESEAISLAKSRNLPLIIDEKKGRKIAQNLNIKIIGLLGVIYLNIKKGLLTEHEAKEFLDNVKTGGFRISQKLIDDMFESLRYSK